MFGWFVFMALIGGPVICALVILIMHYVLKVKEDKNMFGKKVKVKWICHVTGVDDIHECKNELEALRMANTTNKAVLSVERKEHDPIVIAVAKKETPVTEHT